MSWLLVGSGLTWLGIVCFAMLLDRRITWIDVALVVGLCFCGAVARVGEELRPPASAAAPQPDGGSRP